MKILSPLLAHIRAIGFVVRLLPNFPAWPIDVMTRAPVIERMRYPTADGEVETDLYRPPGNGPFPAVVICLGVVPFGVDHPQIPRLQAALARFGFLAVIHWSPAMRDRRLVPGDVAGIASAYDRMLLRSDVDPKRSGLFGTCVGGSFALLAAGDPSIRDRVAFVGAFAPYSSMWTLARDVASKTRSNDRSREPWSVDPLTSAVFVRSITDVLDTGERERLREVFANGGSIDPAGLSADGRAVHALVAAQGRDAAERALRQLPSAMRERLDALSPLDRASLTSGRR